MTPLEYLDSLIAGQKISSIPVQLSELEYLKALLTPKPYIPKCSCCGTTENLHADLGSGGPYRCNSGDCIVF